MRDPKEIVERVEDQVNMILAIMLLAPIFIWLIGMDHVLVDTSATSDSLDLLFLLFWMTFVFVMLAISMRNVVRVKYTEHGRNPFFKVKLHAYGAWIFVAFARALTVMVMFLIIEFNLKKVTCFSAWMRLLVVATGILVALGFLFDSYIWLVEADPDYTPSVVSDVAGDYTPLAALDAALIHGGVLEGKRVEKAAARQLTMVVCSKS